MVEMHHYMITPFSHFLKNRELMTLDEVKRPRPIKTSFYSGRINCGEEEMRTGLGRIRRLPSRKLTEQELIEAWKCLDLRCEVLDFKCAALFKLYYFNS